MVISPIIYCQLLEPFTYLGLESLPTLPYCFRQFLDISFSNLVSLFENFCQNKLPFVSNIAIHLLAICETFTFLVIASDFSFPYCFRQFFDISFSSLGHTLENFVRYSALYLVLSPHNHWKFLKLLCFQWWKVFFLFQIVFDNFSFSNFATYSRKFCQI